VTEGGRNYLEVVERAVVQIAITGPTLKIESEQMTRLDDSLRPVVIRLYENEMGREKITEATVAADGLRVTVTAPNTHETKTLSITDHFGSDLQLWPELIAGKLKLGDSRTVEVFRPEVDEMDDDIITVLALPTPTDGRYKLGSKSARMGVEAFTYLLPDGTIVRQEAPGLLDMILARVTEQEALSASTSPLKISNSIKADRAIPDTVALTDLSLIARGRAESPASYIPSSPRQRVTAQPDLSAALKIVRRPFSGAAARLPIADPNLAEYLKPTEVAQSDNPEIIKTAREIVGNETDAWKAAVALNKWVFDHMVKVESEPQPVTALEVLHSMRGCCSEHATLLAALARAVGLPSQFVTGVVYKNGAFWYHAWDKVYVGEWVDMDPTWDETTINVGHIELACGSLDELSMARMNLATGRTIGALDLIVKDWRPR
jgi:hypothetical protein